MDSVDNYLDNIWRRGKLTSLLSKVAGHVPPKVLHAAIARVHHRPEPIMKLLVRNCDPLGSAVDVGVWLGPWTYWLARRVYRVHAIEPNPSMVDFLRRSVASNVNVYAAAASNSTGSDVLNFPIMGFGSEGTATLKKIEGAATSVQVDLLRIDDLCLDDVRFMKIDVEGHELQVLEGALETLRSQSPVLLTELDYREGDFGEIARLLESLGYQGKVLIEGSWTNLSDFDLAEWQRQHHATQAQQSYFNQVLHTQSYINNVVWVHPRSTWNPWSL